jgi:predicted  nucleic acid-binding Zn-ribbon protein
MPTTTEIETLQAEAGEMEAKQAAAREELAAVNADIVQGKPGAASLAAGINAQLAAFAARTQELSERIFNTQQRGAQQAAAAREAQHLATLEEMASQAEAIAARIETRSADAVQVLESAASVVTADKRALEAIQKQFEQVRGNVTADALAARGVAVEPITTPVRALARDCFWRTGTAVSPHTAREYFWHAQAAHERNLLRQEKEEARRQRSEHLKAA